MHTQGPPPHPLFPLSLATDRDRRSQPRLSAEVLGLDAEASLSQGVYVRILNVSTGGALLELDEWIRPGTRSGLKLTRSLDDMRGAERLAARGQIVRCWVDRIAPLRYRAAMLFEQPTAGPVPTPSRGHDEADLTGLLECSA